MSMGKSSRTYPQTVFFIDSKLLGLPSFKMRPQHFFDRLAQTFKLQQVLKTIAIFQTHYVVQGDDEAVVRSVFSPNVLQHFTINKQWSLEGVGFFSYCTNMASCYRRPN
jgi:hypothetical protein